MFTKITIRDFKNFQGNNEIDLRPITVLIGPNGTGKSTVAQVVQLFRQSVGQDRIQLATPASDMGLIEDVMTPSGLPPIIGLAGKKKLSLSVLSLGAETSTVSISVLVDVASRNTRNTELTTDTSLLPTLRILGVGENRSVSPQALVISGSSWIFGPNDRVTGGIEVTSRAGGGDRRVDNEVRSVTNVLMTMLSETRVIPPLRGFESARYPLGAGVSDDFASSIHPRENALALATSIAYSDDLREAIGSALSEITAVGIDNILVPSNTVSPVTLRYVDGATKKVVPTNEGFGTNQLIHLLAQVFSTPVGGTLIIEEPEIHLHPLSQVKLGSWLAHHATDSQKQLIIVTHSEHLLASLLWQIRKEVLDPSDLAVHYFKSNTYGVAEFTRHDVTHGGIVQGSFREFFGDPEVYPEWNEFFRGLH